MPKKKPLVLVKIDTNWADEFDVLGFEIMPQGQWDEYVAGLDKVKWPLEQYYGTNEYFDIDSKEAFLQGVTAQPITEQEADIFRKFFNKYGGKVLFGFPIPDILEILSEQAYDEASDEAF